MLQSAFSIYLLIGAGIGLMMVCKGTRAWPAHVYLVAMFALIAFWPAFVFTGVVRHLRKG
jgi:membrane protein YdbS with pleckstrin-like domain